MIAASCRALSWAALFADAPGPSPVQTGAMRFALDPDQGPVAGGGSAADPLDGAVTLRVAGVDLHLMPEGVLWWAAEHTLVVADLHLEKSSSFARRGALLPPYDTAATLRLLGRAIDRLDPARVVSLGDAFHDRFGPDRLGEDDRAAIERLQHGRDWIWIAGNHDPVLSRPMGGVVTDTWCCGGLTFRHEPARDPDAAHGEIAGHLHPSALVALPAKAVRRRCFAGDGARLILPAFGVLTGGLCLGDPAFDGLFDRPNLTVGLLGDGRVYRFPGRLLATRHDGHGGAPGYQRASLR
jgi:hypothetical protein